MGCKGFGFVRCLVCGICYTIKFFMPKTDEEQMQNILRYKDMKADKKTKQNKKQVKQTKQSEN